MQSSVITLKELSRLSGFSVSTISKALNDKLDISQETRKSIKGMAEKYNYVPNNFAVGLRKKRTQTIAVIIPQVNTEFYGCFLYNIEKVASSYGYKIILFQSFEENSKEIECVKNSNDGSVDGIIMLSKNTESIAVSQNRTLPIERVQIEENEDFEQLKKICIRSFTKLLKRIE